MKTAVMTLALGALAFIGLAPEAQAGPRFSIGFGHSPFGNHIVSPRVPFSPFQGHSVQRPPHGSHQSHSFQGRHSGFVSGGHCATPYVVRTCEISRRQHCVTAYTSCGRPYPVHMTVVTYRDQYSNGTYRTYTRTFR